MSQAIESAVVESLTQSLITAIKDQLKYVFSYKTYVKDLNEGLAALEVARERNEKDVELANNNCQTIYTDVTTWLDNAGKISEQAKKVMERHQNYSSRGCFSRVIPNVSTRFRIAKLAEGNKQEIDKLLKSKSFQSVSHPETIGIVRGIYQGPEYSWIAQSRKLLLEEMSEVLLDDKVRIVGIWGASGVGKSTLLKQLEKQVHEGQLNYDFNAVTMATVSRTPNWERVQDVLGYRLGLNMMDRNSMDLKAACLHERLCGKDKILIILDDIWEKVDLVKLGIHLDDNDPEIKLLLTSRSEQVLKDMIASKHVFQLKRLEQGEAVELFRKIVGEEVHVESRLIEILVKECTGLPILISPLARFLKPSHPSTWVDAFTELKQSRNFGIEDFLRTTLDFNYHVVESEATKSLFFLCSQIGDQIISTNNLVLYGMGVGLFKGFRRIEEVREKIKLLLGNLKASCLLEDYGDGCVKLHDMMADVALSIAPNAHTSVIICSGNNFNAYHDDEFRGCKSICLHLEDETYELPERLLCPTLDMFIIRGAYSYLSTSYCLAIPDGFFINMKELKVLHVSKLQITKLPSSIQFLSKLHTLWLDGVDIDDVAMVGKLKALQVLTLGGESIARLSKEIGDLNNLRHLNLTYCWNLQVIESNVLGRLTCLEELTLPLHYNNWDVEGSKNASLTELNNMPRLSTLVICVPNVASLAYISLLQQLMRYRISMTKDGSLRDNGETKSLELRFDTRSDELIWSKRLQTVLKKSQELHLSGWNGIEDTVTNLCTNGFLELKHIRVQNCPSIQYIFHLTQSNLLPILESLTLERLINLQEICRGDLPHNSLRNLKVIKIDACDELRNLLSFSLVKELPLLQVVEISDCPKIKKIIQYTEVDSLHCKGKDSEKVEILELKYLDNLKLLNLQNISSFCSKSEIDKDDAEPSFEFLDGRLVSFPCLMSLTLGELPQLKKISHSQHTVNLGHLNSLELFKCKSLSYALDSNLLQQLRHLQSLEVADCDLMETVFHLEGFNTHEANSNESPRVNLKLSNLPKLEKIWNWNTGEIPSFLELKKLEVSKCDKLENLSSLCMVKMLEKISHLSITSCMAMKEILVEEENDDHEIKFPFLTELIISKCPKMRVFVSAKHGKEHLLSEDTTGNGPFFSKKVHLPGLEKLVLRSMESMTSIWEDNNLSENSFFKLTSIGVEECSRLQSLFVPQLMERMQNLSKVKVESCDSLKVLESQSVKEATLGFSSLQDIFVRNCCRLEKLFSNAIVRTLSKLVNMHISSCQRLVEVVPCDDKEGVTDMTKKMRFHNLRSLQLEGLDSLVCFCKGNYVLYFPSLKKLSIIRCFKMKEFGLRSSNLAGSKEQIHKISSTSNAQVGFSPFFDEKALFPTLEEVQIKGLQVKEIWPKKDGASFLELKKLEVEDCHQLSIIVPSFIIHTLHRLEVLSVKSCKSMEAVFELEKQSIRRRGISGRKSTKKILEHLHGLDVSSCGSMQHIITVRGGNYIEEANYGTVIFPQLSSLKLSQLPRLGTFCPEYHKIDLPSLMKMSIRDCQSVEVFIGDYDKNGKPLLLVEKVEFPRLQSMEIKVMQKLRKLWHISNEDTDSECSSEGFCELRSLTVHNCDNLSTVFPSTMIRSFCGLTKLFIWKCESLESVFESPPRLRRETQCNNYNDTDAVLTTFALRELSLWNLPRMKHVWAVEEDPTWAYLSFEQLYEVEINRCCSLKHLFPASVARSLLQLYRLKAVDCEGMEEIVWSKESSHHQFASTPSLESINFTLGTHSLEWPSMEILELQESPNAKIFASVHEKVNIPELKRLRIDASTLENLHFTDQIYANVTSLTLVSRGGQAWVNSNLWSLLVEKFPNLRDLGISLYDFKEIFPSDNEKNEATIISYKSGIPETIETLEIFSCPYLTILLPSAALFPNITNLVVRECDGLQYLVTSSVARGLVQLTNLSVYDCKNLKEIVTNDCDENGNGANDDHADISFPYLNTLWLYKLQSLQSFSSTSCKFNFPSLVRVDMSTLPEMHVFCQGDFTAPCKTEMTRKIGALQKQEIESLWIGP